MTEEEEEVVTALYQKQPKKLKEMEIDCECLAITDKAQHSTNRHKGIAGQVSH